MVACIGGFAGSIKQRRNCGEKIDPL